MNDPEEARYLASLPKPDEEWSPSVSEFDLTAHLLREILHSIKGLRQATLAVGGINPGQDKPFPAPRTEVERAIENIERQWAESFVAQFGFDANDI